MLVVFSSGMICNAVLGEPILAPLRNTPQVVVATVVWLVRKKNENKNHKSIKNLKNEKIKKIKITLSFLIYLLFLF